MAVKHHDDPVRQRHKLFQVFRYQHDPRAVCSGVEQLAMDVCDRDDEVNQLQDQIFQDLLACMTEDSGSVRQALQMIFISRHVERLADHATNIAEGVVYFSEGRVIKHHATDDPNQPPIRPESGGPA